jgi:polyhydroxybutyrate depolymerase
MEKIYRAKRHLQRRSYLRTMHAFAWIIICLFVAAVVGGLLLQTQSLRQDNNDLRSRLAQVSSSRPAPLCHMMSDWTAGQTKQQTITVNDQPRTFYIHVPSNYRDGAYYPVLLFYVGRGANAKAGQAAYGLDTLPGIVVYPEPTMGNQNMTAWQGAPYSSAADDVAFTSAIISHLRSDLCIDLARIYAAGLSNGGGFVSLLSCKLPDQFAAYAVVAGATYPPEDNCKPPKPAPLINIHGDSDQTVPYFGSVVRRLPPVESWIAQRAHDEQCGSSTTTYPDTTTVLTSWNACREGGVVQNVRIAGGRHGWGPVSNDTIWQFLSQFSLRTVPNRDNLLH